jgi:starvation-inducible outer membrane lipoprotein
MRSNLKMAIWASAFSLCIALASCVSTPAILGAINASAPALCSQIYKNAAKDAACVTDAGFATTVGAAIAAGAVPGS